MFVLVHLLWRLPFLDQTPGWFHDVLPSRTELVHVMTTSEMSGHTPKTALRFGSGVWCKHATWIYLVGWHLRGRAMAQNKGSLSEVLQDTKRLNGKIEWESARPTSFIMDLHWSRILNMSLVIACHESLLRKCDPVRLIGHKSHQGYSDLKFAMTRQGLKRSFHSVEGHQHFPWNDECISVP